MSHVTSSDFCKCYTAVICLFIFSIVYAITSCQQLESQIFNVGKFLTNTQISSASTMKFLVFFFTPVNVQYEIQNWHSFAT